MTEIIIHDIASRKRVIDHIGTLSLEGLPWIVDIKRKTKRRSLSQNALFHKWVDFIANEVGYEVWDSERMKAELKIVCQCPATKYVGLDGTEREERSTSKLNTADMAEFMTRVERFAASELGIIVPSPDDVQRMW